MKKLKINQLYNDVVDVVEYVENIIGYNEFDNIFKTFNKSNSFIINRYYENDIVGLIKKEYDVEIEKKYNTYKLNNKNIFDVELIVIDPIFKSIFINENQLIKIFDEKIDDINKIFESNIKQVQQLIHDEIYKIFDKNDDEYMNYYSIKNKINSYDLLILFENITNIISCWNDENDDENENVDVDDLLKLFEYVIDELNKFSYFNSNRKFKIDIGLMNILNNNHIFINDDFFYVEIDENYLKYDLNEYIDDFIIKYFNIDIDEIINEKIFYEILLIDMINNNISNMDINYNYVMNNKNEYQINENSIEISIDEILNINMELNDIHDLKFNPFEIDDLIENYNNNLSFDEFIYGLIDDEYELLDDDEFYDKWNYIINDKIKFKNLTGLYNYCLNYLSNLNLNKSFKFNDDVYELYL